MEEGVKRLDAALAIALLEWLAGCATVTTGNSQRLTVNTDPPGADCTLTQGSTVVGHVNPTPGVIAVQRSRDDIRVACKKEGYEEADYVNRSGFEAMTVGNVILGGVVGIAIDAASGATNKYDEKMYIRLASASAGPEAPASAASPAPTPASAPASAGPAATVAYSRYESATAEFHCPAAGTLIRTSTNASFKFTEESGFACGYLDQQGAQRQRYAVFADGYGRLARKEIAALWPLKVGSSVEFVITDDTAPQMRKRDYAESFSVVRTETVTVPAGTFDTFVVEWHEKSTNPTLRSEAIVTSWYAPRIGYVVKSSVKILERGTTDPDAAGLYAGLDYEATEIALPAVSMR
jgi:hypothetical protein